ncbi:hypothetical protein DQ241_10995 [Blastococcus sp. TF02A-30]|nr:hypothetical protein DQ241_10995 [Blastococcus sp. TF02A-30]
MQLISPEEALERYAAVVRYFHPDGDSPVALSSNASIVGGYAESLVGALFVPAGITAWEEIWAQATQFKTSMMDAPARAERREALDLPGRAHDKVDLYVDQEKYRTGRWTAVEPAEGEGPAARRLRALAGQEAKAYLTCQVKARFAWVDRAEYDALPYNLYLRSDLGPLSRDEVLTRDDVWQEWAPDLVAWVRFHVDRSGTLQTSVRLATAEDVRQAIRAYFLWEIEHAEPSRRDRIARSQNSWSGSKISFPHVFGEEGWSGAEDMRDVHIQQLGGPEVWRQWAIGVDVSSVVAPSTTPRPKLPIRTVAPARS